MANKEDQIYLIFINKNLPKKLVFCYVKANVDMYNVKKFLINFFHRNTKPRITDFRLVREGPPEDDQNDTLEENFFDEQYNNMEALSLMHKFNRKNIYFRTIKLTIDVEVITKTKTKSLSYPLSFEGNNLPKLITNIEQDMNFELSKPYYFYQKGSYDIVPPESDMKKYASTGLILYVFPIKAEFINMTNNDKTNIFLKYDKPLKDYLQETISKKLKITSTNLLLKIKNGSSFVDVNIDVPVHQILKLQNEEPVIFEIIDTTPNKIAISIPLRKSEVVNINFEYKSDKMKIDDLIKAIKEYFDIKSKKVQLFHDSDEIDKTKLVKPYSSKNQTLVLKCDKLDDLILKRNFRIKNSVISKEIILSSTVSSIIKDIANDYGSDQSLISLSLDTIAMSQSVLFANYFIPPQKEIIVEIKDFTKFVTLKVHGIPSSSNIQFKVGFTPKMKIKSLRNSKEFQKKIPQNLRSSLFFFYDDTKLVESLTFDSYNIEGDEVIEACASKCYIFKSKDKMLLVCGDKKIDALKDKFQEQFELPSDQFLIEQGGKILPPHFSTGKYPNGTTFELTVPTQMQFMVDGKHKIEVNSSEKVKAIISKFVKKTHSKESDVQLLNEEGELLEPDSYIFSSFDDKGKSHVYELTSQKSKKFAFQTTNGKYMMESLVPTMKVGEALDVLRRRGKKIKDNAFIIYMGQIVDNNSTLLSLFGNKGYDESDDAEPFLIETEIPDQITVELKFQAGKMKTKNACKFHFIEGTTVFNVRYLASILSEQDIDAISLEANDQILNDEDVLDEDTEIIVDLSQAIRETKSSKNIQEILTTTQKRATQKEKDQKGATRITTRRKEEVVENDEDEDDLEYSNDDDDDEDDDDISKKGDGNIIKPSKTDPENEYIYKFKEIGGDEFLLSLAKNVTVKEVKEKIVEDRGASAEDVTIFIGNQRLADFNKLSYLTIPQKVKFFTVKVIDLKNTLILSQRPIKIQESLVKTQKRVVQKEKVDDDNIKNKKSDSTDDDDENEGPFSSNSLSIISSEEEAERYTIDCTIEENDNSIVYKIIEKATLKPFCKKVLNSENAEFKDFQNLMKEFELLRSLNHPCICHSYYINCQDQLKDSKPTFSMITEFIDFKLSDYLSNKLISNTLKTRIIVEISHGMKYLHSKGHIYRDLNIDNIMLTLNMQAKLINFGYAHISEIINGEDSLSMSSMTKKIGSEDFMSPEMANDDDDDGKYSNKTDVYSFGVVVYKMFVGKVPEQSFKDKIERKPVKMPKESKSVSIVCIDLMSKCLSIDPDCRPSFEEILDYLRENKFLLASDVDPSIISQRDKELESIKY